MATLMEIEQARFIELIALWEGKINGTHLQQYFNISRPTSTKLLQLYTQNHPDNLCYDSSLKGQIPKPQFKPHYCKGTIEEYYTLLANNPGSDHANFIHSNFSLVEAPLRNISPDLVRPIIKAIREKKRLDVGYASVSNPDYEERIISPHSLVFNGVRWHTRAYCEKNQAFRDFVLSRFNGFFNEEGPAEFHNEHDKKWNTLIDLIIEPDPRLIDAQQRIIEMDYQMENGQRIIKTRAALLMYLLQKLHIDQYKPTAEAQQIIVNSECWKQIEQYLPR